MPVPTFETNQDGPLTTPSKWGERGHAPHMSEGMGRRRRRVGEREGRGTLFGGALQDVRCHKAAPSLRLPDLMAYARIIATDGGSWDLRERGKTCSAREREASHFYTRLLGFSLCSWGLEEALRFTAVFNGLHLRYLYSHCKWTNFHTFSGLVTSSCVCVCVYLGSSRLFPKDFWICSLLLRAALAFCSKAF